jgi:hypothetical protein
MFFVQKCKNLQAHYKNTHYIFFSCSIAMICVFVTEIYYMHILKNNNNLLLDITRTINLKGMKVNIDLKKEAELQRNLLVIICIFLPIYLALYLLYRKKALIWIVIALICFRVTFFSFKYLTTEKNDFAVLVVFFQIPILESKISEIESKFNSISHKNKPQIFLMSCSFFLIFLFTAFILLEISPLVKKIENEILFNSLKKIGVYYSSIE